MAMEVKENNISSSSVSEYSPGDIADHYNISDEIGRGSFSVVKRGVNKKSGKEYAIKCIQKNTLNFISLKGKSKS